MSRIYTAALSLIVLATPTLAEVPKVVTDIAPIHSLVAQVMGDLGTPSLVVPPSSSPHGFALRASQAAALQDADVVIWVSHELTPWLGDALEVMASTAAVIELAELKNPMALEQRDGVLFEHEAHEGHAHGHEEEALDPHLWLAPDNARFWLALIADTLASEDPENADIYRTNASSAQSRIITLTAEIAATLGPVQTQDYIVFHDSYQYFEESFDLHTTAAISLSDATTPGPARLRDIQTILHENTIACAFAEPQFNPGLIATVIEGTDVKQATLDPIGALHSPGPAFYEALLRGLADGLATCLR
jgi:zinc transport system substrate-binding protein